MTPDRTKHGSSQAAYIWLHGSTNPDIYLALVSELSGISQRDILGTSRAQEIMRARQLLYAVLRGVGWSYPRIGKFVGRDHTSVMSGVKQVPEQAVREILDLAKVD